MAGADNFKCRECGQSFTSKRSLDGHAAAAHKKRKNKDELFYTRKKAKVVSQEMQGGIATLQQANVEPVATSTERPMQSVEFYYRSQSQHNYQQNAFETPYQFHGPPVMPVNVKQQHDFLPMNSPLGGSMIQGLSTHATAPTTRFSAETKGPTNFRRKFTDYETNFLEQVFLAYDGYVTPQERREIARKLNVPESKVTSWFYSRRMKLRRQIVKLQKPEEFNVAAQPEAVHNSNKFKLNRSLSIESVSSCSTAPSPDQWMPTSINESVSMSSPSESAHELDMQQFCDNSMKYCYNNVPTYRYVADTVGHFYQPHCEPNQQFHVLDSTNRPSYPSNDNNDPMQMHQVSSNSKENQPMTQQVSDNLNDVNPSVYELINDGDLQDLIDLIKTYEYSTNESDIFNLVLNEDNTSGTPDKPFNLTTYWQDFDCDDPKFFNI